MSDRDGGATDEPARAPGAVRAVEVAPEPPPIGSALDEPVPDGDAKRQAQEEASPSPPDARRPTHWLSFFLIAGGVVVADQLSKRLVDQRMALGDSWPSADWPVRLMYVKNTGAAFSMLQSQTLFLTVMSVVGLGAIVLYFLYRPSDHPLLRIALALQLGGAIGNLIDRARFGEVTDFIKVPHWPVFNVADSAISVGVTAVIIFLLFAGGEGKQRPAGET